MTTNATAGGARITAGRAPRTVSHLELIVNQPQHTPAEAVQYWYDAATERREERDCLRAVVARIRQMADCWEQQLPEVIRTPAVVSALRAALEPAAASAVVAPPTDRPAVLREIATTLDQLAETDVIRKRRSLATARRLLAVELRRMADEPAPVAQQPAAFEGTCQCGHPMHSGACDGCFVERGHHASIHAAVREQPAAADGEETRRG